MKDEEIFKLENSDSQDISDILVKVEKSFNFKFGSTELIGVKTFGELCDIIVNKISLQDISDCTTQQAFYKLRNAISRITGKDKSLIISNSDLTILFHKLERRKNIKLVEKEIGFKMKVLRPRNIFPAFFAFLFIISLLAFFVSWKYALVGILISLIGINIANTFGKEFVLNTVGELAEKISCENYFNSRRNSKSVNKFEVVQKVEQLFHNDLGIEFKYLTRDATFN